MQDTQPTLIIRREPGSRLRHGPALRRLAINAVIVLTIAAIAEWGIRRAAPRYLFHRTDAAYTGGYPLALNADGSRGAAVAVEKPSGTFRVLCLGDSASFGTGAAAETTFAARVAPLVRATRGSPVESINAGAPGFAVKDLQLALEQRWMAYRPDVVVLTVSGNCASWAWVRRDEVPHMPYPESRAGQAQESKADQGAAERLKTLLASCKQTSKAARHRLALATFLRLNSERVLYKVGLLNHLVKPELPLGSLLAHGWQQANIPAETREGVMTAFGHDFESFIAAAREMGIPVIVAVVPPSFTISKLPIDNEKCVPTARIGRDFGDHVAELCRRLDVPYADVPAALRAARSSGPTLQLYRQMDYTHLATAGHEVAAAAVAGAIKPVAFQGGAR